MRIDITEKNMVWLVEHKMADTIVAEFHRKEAVIESLVSENARLKAEVERLTFDPLTYLDDQGEWMPRHIHLAAVERLQAEVERLKFEIEVHRQGWNSEDIYNHECKLEVEEMRRAAKEGKQS